MPGSANTGANSGQSVIDTGGDHAFYLQLPHQEQLIGHRWGDQGPAVPPMLGSGRAADVGQSGNGMLPELPMSTRFAALARVTTVAVPSCPSRSNIAAVPTAIPSLTVRSRA